MTKTEMKLLFYPRIEPGNESLLKIHAKVFQQTRRDVNV